MPTAKVKAFAKINLGLRILGRRSDGFHELRTVYQTVSLHDTIEVSLSSRLGREPVILAVKGIDVPPGRDNLAVRAGLAMGEALALKQQVSIRLTKRIPTGGGLGGGSSDAAAVIRALDALTGQRLKRSTLYGIAAGVGSDVPFFLFGGRAIGVGRGEEVYPLPDGPRLHCLIAVPADGMNTAEAYRLLAAKPWPPKRAGLPNIGPRAEKLTAPKPRPTMDSFCASLLAADGSDAPQGPCPVENDFERLLFRMYPQLAAAKRVMLRCGAVGAALTGSGSAIFGLFTSSHVADQALRKLAGARPNTGMTLFRCQTTGRRTARRIQIT